MMTIVMVEWCKKFRHGGDSIKNLIRSRASRVTASDENVRQLEKAWRGLEP